MTEDVVQLPQPKNRPAHTFGEPSIVAPAWSRHEQSERICTRCGVVKITVMPNGADAWRAWRLPGTTAQFVDDHAPPCVPLLAAAP